jgi:hypothetical protein
MILLRRLKRKRKKPLNKPNIRSKKVIAEGEVDENAGTGRGESGTEAEETGFIGSRGWDRDRTSGNQTSCINNCLETNHKKALLNQKP